MSGFLSPKYLRYRDLATGKTREIDGDLSCKGCGYNLRGLVFGGRCPECGLGIDAMPATSRGGVVLNIIVPDDPAARLRMRIGLRAGAIALGVMIVCRLWTLTPLPGRADLAVVDLVSLVASLVWLVCVLMVTPRTLNGYGPVMRIVRHMVRISQFAWPIAYGAIFYYDTAAFGAAMTDAARIAWMIGRIVGGCGVLLFFYMMSVPAYDARCDRESKRLVANFWLLLFSSPFIGLLPRGMAPVGIFWIIYGFIAIFIILWAIPALLAVFHIYVLGSTAAYASSDIARRGLRDERIRETRAEMDAAVRATIRRYPADDSADCVHSSPTPSE